MKDSFRHKGLRKKLVDELKNKGIYNESVLKAINKVPRHLFMDSSFVDHSYIDKAFPIGCNQTISQPFTVAFQTQLLEIKKGHKVLEIGTGSGYQCSILSLLCRRVYTVERIKSLLVKAELIFKKLKLTNIVTKHDDGNLGWKEQIPFDKIIFTAVTEEIPNSFFSLIDSLLWVVVSG